MRVIIDTNFLLIPAQFKVDIFSEIQGLCGLSCEMVVIDKTLDELHGIMVVGKGMDKRAAKLALDLIKHKKVKEIKTKKDKHVDFLILESLKQGDVVATQDIGLKKLLSGKAKIIGLRAKKQLYMA